MIRAIIIGLSFIATLAVSSSVYAQAPPVGEQWCDVLAPDSNQSGGCTPGAGVYSHALSYSTDKQDFIEALERYESYGGYQRIGARYIMCELEGRDANGGHCSSDGTWKRRLLDPSVTLSIEEYFPNGCYNTAFVRSLNEVYRYDGSEYGESCGPFVALMFRVDGRARYAIKIDCGNPLGDLGGLWEIDVWEIQPSISVSHSGPKPTPAGGTITWQYRARNNGPDDASNVRIGYRDYPPLSGSTRDVFTRNIRTLYAGDTESGSITHNIRQDDVGQNLCRSAIANPAANWDRVTVASSSACVYVPYDYSLNPSVNTSDWGSNSTGTMEYGQEYTIAGNIDNAGPTKSHSDIEWRLTEAVFRPGIDTSGWKSGVHENSSDPCVFLSGNKLCRSADTGDGDTIYPNPSGVNGRGEYRGGVPAGASVDDEICYMLSVRSFSSDSRVGDRSNRSPWRHSALVCRVIGKRPKVQFWGADVRTNGLVRTNISTLAGNTYGAWAEYGIIANHRVVSSSDAGLASGSGGVPGVPTESDYNKLTFANGGVSGFGSFGGSFSTSLPNLQRADSSIGGHVAIADLASGSYRREGDLVIDGGEVPQGRRLIIEATGTITITGNITYADGPYDNLEDLPQVVVRGTNIAIDPAVSQIDSWLLTSSGTASGYVSTCGNVANLSDNMENCGNMLRVNGLISTNSLYLRRTYGADESDPGSPAEVINLRPDVYLWSFAESKRSGAIRTMHVRELPPRF